jgi:hypothetical protein
MSCFSNVRLGPRPLISAAFEQDWAVCGLDPRDVGELVTTQPGWVLSVGLSLGESFVCRQPDDVSRVMNAQGVAGLSPGKPIDLTRAARTPRSWRPTALPASRGTGAVRPDWIGTPSARDS